MAECRVKHVVVDSGGFIKNAPLKDIGEKVHTIGEVVNEITDKATRQRLQVLPYELNFKEPSTDAIRIVTEFSKKTGDYRSLSAVDIKLMALVYQLEKEINGTDHIKTTPQTQSTWTTTKKHLEKPTEIAGFYLKKKGDTSTASSRTTSVSEVDAVTCSLQASTLKSTPEEQSSRQLTPDQTDISSETPSDRLSKEASDNLENQNPQDSDSPSHDKESRTVHIDIVDVPDKIEFSGDSKSKESPVSNVPCADGQTLPSNLISEDYEESSDDEEEDSSSEDDEGWITPGNISAVKRSMGAVDAEQAVVDVGCLTLDFSMQNVLIQMGLNVISVDGMLIKRAKSYVQRCSACMKVCTNMEKSFCPTCGNNTLHRVAMTVNDDGSIQYFLSRRRPVNLRGLKYSIPNPKGGKYNTNPLMCEDQPKPHQRLSKKAQVKYNVFEAGYIANSSPFAPQDTHSRSAQLGFGVRKKRKNPNENKKVYGRRK